MVHPSLLPRYRGAAPIQHALLNDERETGVSIVEVSPGKFDAGRVWLQEALPVQPTDTYKSLSDSLVVLAGRLANQLIDGHPLARSPVVQEDRLATPAPKFEADGNLYLLGLARQPRTVQQVYCMYRAFFGSSLKTLKLRFKARLLLVDDCQPLTLQELRADSHSFDSADRDRLLSLHARLRPGQLVYFPHVKPLRHKVALTLDDGWLLIHKLHFAGGQLRSSKEFIREELSTEGYRAFSSALTKGEASSTGYDLHQIE